MTHWLDAFVPVFGLLGLGALLRRRLMREDVIWAGIERLVFWVLLPCLIVAALAGMRMADLPVGGLAVAIWGALLGGTAVSLLLAWALGAAHPAMTSILQGGIRFNTLMGFAIGGAIWGPPGIALCAICTGLIVPVVQTISTLAFAFGGTNRVRPMRLARQVLLNPLIIACAAGFALSMLGGVPAGLGPMVRALGQASVALGLLCVGAALTLKGLGQRPVIQAATALLKLGVVPLFTYGLATALGLAPLPTAIAVMLMALPTAATSYVMSRAMGGDAPLMAAITTSEHVVSILTLPLWIWFLGARV